MSYILDALRKSDQQRRVGQVPSLTFAPQAPVAREPHALAIYGSLGVIVIISIGMVLVWLRPLSNASAPVTPIAEKSVEMPPRQPAPSLLPVTPEKIAVEPLRSVAPPIAPPVLKEKAKAPATANTEQRYMQAKAVAANRPMVPAIERVLPGNAPDADFTPPKTLAGSAELPHSIRKTLPVMTVAVHAYSDKAEDRLVSVNGRLLHEGDALAPGLRLDQITPEGMIFSYRGYRFRRGAQ